MLSFRRVFFAPALLLGNCQINDIECDSACQLSWMDGGNTGEDSLARDSLLSVRLPNPDSATLQKRVIVAAHGFTASTYEWKEFKRYADTADTSVLLSLVLLGGHGTSIENFRNSAWEDWGRPILEEYDTLWRMGYRRISLLTSSTGGPLVVQHVHDRTFDAQPPEHILLIDPIVVPSAKILAASNLFGPILGNSPNPGDTPEEHANWYNNRPEEVLRELYELINQVKNELEGGITLPPGTRCKVWKSLHDGASDPVSALLLYKGLRHADGSRIEAQLVDSRLHVFTRLQGRRPGMATAADSALQMATFAEIINRVKQ